MSWNLLKLGGVVMFDDYGWGDWMKDPRMKPKLGIEPFEAVYGDRLELLSSGWRRAFRKILA